MIQVQMGLQCTFTKYVTKVPSPKSGLIEMTKATIKQLEKKFDDLILTARKYMVTTQVDVQDLLHSITRLPGDLKSEHKLFTKTIY